jgi:hypothetical protein
MKNRRTISTNAEAYLMSTYEKIASILLVILFAVILILSYGNLKNHEAAEQSVQGASDFDESTGQDFKIGPFATTTSERVSGGIEASCTLIQPVIIAALHDLDTRLIEQAATFGISGKWDAFEVNAPTLDALCNKNVEMVLADGNGNTLTLVKTPFARAIPQGGDSGDMGTSVTLTATITRLDGTPSSKPTAYARILIPDRFLDAVASSSPQ